MTRFERLLDIGRAQGSTSLTDPGTGVRASIRPEPGEQIVAFRLDTPQGREVLGVGNEVPLCEGGFHYQRASVVPAIVLLVELKGNDVKHAVEQILSAHRILRPVASDVAYRAAIVTVGSGLPRTDELQKRMPRELRLRVLRTRKGEPRDLRECLAS